jgi:hypothetical protein
MIMHAVSLSVSLISSEITRQYSFNWVHSSYFWRKIEEWEGKLKETKINPKITEIK